MGFLDLKKSDGSGGRQYSLVSQSTCPKIEIKRFDGKKLVSKILICIDGGEFSSSKPTVKYPADEKKIVVKIERDGYQAFISSVYTAKVSNGQI